MMKKSLLVIALLAGATPAAAQVDPLLFLKGTIPNVLMVVDTGNRMQRDAPDALGVSNYYDTVIYPLSPTPNPDWKDTLVVNSTNTTASYRRKYVGLVNNSDSSSNRFSTATISVTRDQEVAAYAAFEAPTRLSIARAAVSQAILENMSVARFGLLKMRQTSPSIVLTAGNSGPVDPNNDPLQTGSHPTELSSDRWDISRPTVGGRNGSANASTALLVQADAATANTATLAILAKDTRTAGGLLPAGRDQADQFDWPVKFMLDDAKTEAVRLINNADAGECRNTVVVLIVAGGEGNTGGYGNDNAAKLAGIVNVADDFLTLGSPARRVPIYVIALAPPSGDEKTQLQAIATNSGGQYFEITRDDMNKALASPSLYPSPVPGTVVVPEVVNAINTAVQHTFAYPTDFNTLPTVSLPYGPPSEFQVTSPVIGTVNLKGAKDITGAALELTDIEDKSENPIPQRSNVTLTTAFQLPGFRGSLRAFRAYKPDPDEDQISGFKFIADGTRLWVACVPGASCAKEPDSTKRNLFTAQANGTVIAFTAANANLLAPLMNLSVADATVVIDAVRKLPLGPIIDSTPAFQNPPSLDPPPDPDYINFATANKDRRSLIWVGTNHGILEAIDARLGVGVWGFIPLNLLPKLKTLRDGQPVGAFDYFVDGSAKIADVKVDGEWRTHLIIGEGPGGTFYQSIDVTLEAPGLSATTKIADSIAPDSDDLATLLSYFANLSNASKIRFNWAFPRYSTFNPDPTQTDPTPAKRKMPYGDLSASAEDYEKTVGQTWSDPAVGQVASSTGPYTVLVGSGFFPNSPQQQANRGGAVAGSTFYLLNAKDGTVYDYHDVGSDGQNETVDDCAAAVLAGEAAGQGKAKARFPCTQIKNALQSDPVATGAHDSRFISKAYVGDLDGKLWRFDINLDEQGEPTIATTSMVYAAGSDQPIFSSMATVAVSSNQYVFYGTGSDLLPATEANTKYHLLGVLDSGASPALKTLDLTLSKATDKTNDERVTAFPAVAGDIVFFTTTNFRPGTPCAAPDANLYAVTFIGGPAYDNTDDDKVTAADTPLVKTIAGARATAPFIVDQHLVFGAGGKVSITGDPTDYNNGIGQAGVRILSWREVR